MRRVCGAKVTRLTPGDLSVCLRLVASRGVTKGGQESAEAIVAALDSGEGPNMRSGTCTERSMREADAGTKAEKPERSLRAGGGTAEGRETERQACTARNDYAGEGALAPEPHVLVVNRRIRNRTSGGVGGWGCEAPPYPLSFQPDCAYLVEYALRVGPFSCLLHFEVDVWTR